MSKWTRNQKILVGGLIVGIGGLFVQVWSLGKRIQPIIEMKPQIINVINNITKVEKEIANLQEMLKQEDSLKETELFTNSDLNIRVKKARSPDNKIKNGFLVFELKKIPLKNSVLVGRSMGAISPASVRVNKNLIYVGYSNIEDDLKEVLSGGWSITYVPDSQANGLYIIKDASFEFLEKEERIIYYNLKKKE